MRADKGEIKAEVVEEAKEERAKEILPMSSLVMLKPSNSGNTMAIVMSF